MWVWGSHQLSQTFPEGYNALTQGKVSHRPNHTLGESVGEGCLSTPAGYPQAPSARTWPRIWFGLHTFFASRPL